MNRKYWHGLTMLLASCSLFVQAANAAEVVRIGIAGAFSGHSAFLGVDARKGVELAIGQLNSKNTHIQYKLSIADDECTPAGGATAFRNLIDIEEVDVILGSPCSGATLAGMPVLLESKRVSAITFGASNPKITQMGNQYMWRGNLNDAVIANTFAKFIADDGAKVVRMVAINNDFGRGVADVYSKLLPQFGVAFAGADFYMVGASDLRGVLSKTIAASGDALMFIGEAPDCALLVRQLRELNAKQKLYTRASCYTDEALRLMGDPTLANGIVEAAFWGRSEGEPMAEAYKSVHGEYPPYMAATAYYTMQIVDEAVRRGGASAEGITNGLSLVDTELFIGRIKFDDTHQAYPNLYLMQVKDGKGQIMRTVSPKR